MKTFLVPINSLQEKMSTLTYAIDLAKAVGANMIYGIQLNEINKEDHVEELATYAKQQGIAINFRSLPAEVHFIDFITSFSKDFNVDLIIAPARTPKTHEKLYLDNLSGSIVRKTDKPVLLIPENYKFKTVNTLLTAIKSGIVKTDGVLKPLENILLDLKARMTLLQIKTTSFLPEDQNINKDLAAITTNYHASENGTLFQGVLEYIHAVQPDMICVFKRKRGFFKKLWSNAIQDNGINKSDFESRVPLLVLKGDD